MEFNGLGFTVVKLKLLSLQSPNSHRMMNQTCHIISQKKLHQFSTTKFQILHTRKPNHKR